MSAIIVPPLAVSQTDTTRGIGGILRSIFARVWFPVLFLTIWQVIANLNIYPDYVLPGPNAVVVRAGKDMADGYLFAQIGASLYRQISGFLLSVIVGLPLGLLIGISKPLRTAILPTLQVLYPIPGIAWVPLAILWFGIGEASIIFVVFFSAIWALLFNTITGVSAIRPVYRRAAAALSLSSWMKFRYLYVPGSMPFVLAGLRLAYGTSWRVIVGAEIISASSGLGYMINNARSTLVGSEVILGMIVIGLLGYVVERSLFDVIERTTIRRWAMSTPT